MKRVINGMEYEIGPEANLIRANLSGADLSGANLIKANLFGADLIRANLSGANLIRANLSRADLSGANLSRANLSGANLSGADLSGADLIRARGMVGGMFRSDGYLFFAVLGHEEPMVKAGCRWFTITEAHAHWQKTRADTPLGKETFIILDCLEALAKLQQEKRT